MAETHSQAEAVAEHGKGHASRATYWMVALILGIVTLLEVAVFYVPLLHAVIVPVLLALSAFKFALVAAFFMHLRYDRPVLTMVFAGGLMVAIFIILALYFLFHVLAKTPAAGA
jgi:cytochrome c oxidase subunit IV